jgi:hypothetical protein
MDNSIFYCQSYTVLEIFSIYQQGLRPGTDCL